MWKDLRRYRYCCRILTQCSPGSPQRPRLPSSCHLRCREVILPVSPSSVDQLSFSRFLFAWNLPPGLRQASTRQARAWRWAQSATSVELQQCGPTEQALSSLIQTRSRQARASWHHLPSCNCDTEAAFCTRCLSLACFENAILVVQAGSWKLQPQMICAGEGGTSGR